MHTVIVCLALGLPAAALAQTSGGAEIVLDVFSVAPPNAEQVCGVQGTVREVAGQASGEDTRAASRTPDGAAVRAVVQAGQRVQLSVPCTPDDYPAMAAGGVATVRVAADGQVPPGAYQPSAEFGRPREAMARDLRPAAPGITVVPDALCEEILRAHADGRLTGVSAYADGLLDQVGACEATAQDRAARSGASKSG